ncbi:MAG: M28 family peptidase [Bacteroidia bacterium]|nr:M28 family peptidase [Bacteroidia bacterium]
MQIQYANSITRENLKKHLSVLASDEYEGRETGEKGQKMAANYIAAQFKEGNVRPGVGDTSYFQRFPLDVQYKKEVFLTVNNKDYPADKNYLAFYGLSAQTIEAKEIIFAGYGIDDLNYSDYKKTSVENKVVMVLDEEPMGKDSVYFVSKTRKQTAWSTGFRKKEEIARNKNARALFIIVANIDSAYKQYRHRIETKSMKLKSDSVKKKERIPVVFISKQMAKIMLATKGADINKWEERIISKKRTFSESVKAEIKITITIDEKTVNSENVLGYIEGSDLREELVILTAHYDHLGVHEGKVYNGADDDGSGTVGVIELSKAFALAKKEGAGPRRSILFMTVAGEEKGLLGSEYYTENPVYPMKNTVADLNIDMIGRIDERHKDSVDYIYIIGADRLSSELHKISEDANKQYCKLALDYSYNDILDANRFYYRSDHYNFVKKNVPVIFYFNGTHADYHQETDEISKINFELMEKRARLVFYTAWELANRNERIKVDVKQ